MADGDFAILERSHDWLAMPEQLPMTAFQPDALSIETADVRLRNRAQKRSYFRQFATGTCKVRKRMISYYGKGDLPSA